MSKMNTLQKLGLALLVVSPLAGLLGTVVSIYLSFSALNGVENAGIGSVGNQIMHALLFTAAGIAGCLVGLVLFIVGRPKTTDL